MIKPEDFEIQGDTLVSFKRENEWMNASERQSVEIPEGIRVIGPGSFEGEGPDQGECGMYDVLTIPAGVTTIQKEAFAWNTFNELHIPSTITSVAEKAFAHTFNFKVFIGEGAVADWDKAFSSIHKGWCDAQCFNVYASYEDVAGYGLEHSALMTFLKDPFGFTKEQRDGWLEQISSLNKVKLFNDVMQYTIFYNDPRPGWGGIDRLEALRTVLLMNVPTLQAVEKELSKVKGDRPEMVQLLQCYLNDYEKLIAGIGENQKPYTKEQLDELVDTDVAKDAAIKREKYLAKKNAVKNANPEKLWKTRKPKDIGVMEVCAYLGNDTKATIPAKIKDEPVESVNFYNRQTYSARAGIGTLTNIVLASGIKRIGRSAFAGCENLEFVQLPKSITKIDYQAFYNCPKLCLRVPTGSKVEKMVKELGYKYETI